MEVHADHIPPSDSPESGELSLAGNGVHSEIPGAGSNAIRAEDLVQPELLDGGEIVVLAVKPSLWFVIFKSARWLAGALVALVLSRWIGNDAFPINSRTFIQATIALAAARLGVAMMQWVSRLYILTNRRIMRHKGVFTIDMFECQLTKIQSTMLTMTWYERLCGVGTISFVTAGTGGIEVSWSHVNDPQELHERVRSAIQRAQRPGPGI